MPQLFAPGSARDLSLAGRAAIELGYLEIDRRLIVSESLGDTDRRRRATMAPLVRSAWTYAASFATLMLALNALGFDVAGASREPLNVYGCALLLSTLITSHPPSGTLSDWSVSRFIGLAVPRYSASRVATIVRTP
jgi:hypothetical protein